MARVDLASSLYLGMRHPSESLARWSALTYGAPAALHEPPGAASVARELAALVGCPAATLGPSTLHLFMDWFGALPRPDQTTLLLDAEAYPIARWGVERAAARGATARTFRHFSPTALRGELARASRHSSRPIVVTDAYCPGCGRQAPLAAYRALLRPSAGLLVIDDTQALGVIGAQGGGSLRSARLTGEGVVWVASLAKAFGAPLAALGGDVETVEHFVEASQTRLHSSPPSAAAIAAASRALTLNQRHGDTLRRRLTARARRFRAGLASLGLSATGGLHPVQLIDPLAQLSAAALHAGLQSAGIDTALVRAACRQRDAVAVVLTATHTATEIDHALRALATLTRHVLDRHAPTGAERRIHVNDPGPKPAHLG